MKVALDTSAIIYLNNFRDMEMFTVPEVIDEVKDKVSTLKLSGMDIKILEPGEDFVKFVKSAAKGTGDMLKLSKTDIKILAIAKENKLTIISDDYNVQNTADRLGIEFISVFNPRITKQIHWRSYCSSCRRFYDNKTSCPRCGSALTKRPFKIMEMKRKI